MGLKTADSPSDVGQRCFTDARVDWAINELGGVASADCVELGPLEGGHSYMLEQAGANTVTAIEANNNAYLKCLVVKELLGMAQCSFLYGDVLAYLRTTDKTFDVCWCAGILYHMADPITLIALIAQKAKQLYIWTHYYDPSLATEGVGWAKGFKAAAVKHATTDGFTYTAHRHDYGRSRGVNHFWGGNQAFSVWLELDDLLAALEHFGWASVTTQLEPDNADGPAVNLVAVRS